MELGRDGLDCQAGGGLWEMRSGSVLGREGLDCRAGVGLWDTRGGSVLGRVAGIATVGRFALDDATGVLLETFPDVVMVKWY